MDLWKMFENAIASGNWIITIIVGIVIVVYMYVQNRSNNTADILMLCESLKNALDANTANDEENARKDAALAVRVEVLEKKIDDLSTMLGKPENPEG